jgi:hypothetical protein
MCPGWTLPSWQGDSLPARSFDLSHHCICRCFEHKILGVLGRSDLVSECGRTTQVTGIVLDSTWHWFGLVPWVSPVASSVALAVEVIAAPDVIVSPVVFVVSPVGSMPAVLASTSAASPSATVVAQLQDRTSMAFWIMAWGTVRLTLWLSP